MKIHLPSGNPGNLQRMLLSEGWSFAMLSVVPIFVVILKAKQNQDV
jgi:hypothetical protein